MMMMKMMMMKCLEGSNRGLILRYYPGIRMEELRKTTKMLSQDSQFLGRGLNPGHPVYEAGVLTTRPQRSVRLNVVGYIMGE
jgi:hypothetical protein